MNLLVEKLKNGKHSLVVENSRAFRTYDSRGVADLYGILTREPELLAGARVADKVVGKGAAVLMVLGKVESVYAITISKPALNMLMNHGVKVTYETLVDNIINRAGTGICPVESLCADIDSPQQALPLIRDFIENKSQNRF